MHTYARMYAWTPNPNHWLSALIYLAYFSDDYLSLPPQKRTHKSGDLQGRILHRPDVLPVAVSKQWMLSSDISQTQRCSSSRPVLTRVVRALSTNHTQTLLSNRHRRHTHLTVVTNNIHTIHDEITRSVLFSIQDGQIYTRGAFSVPIINPNPISTNANPNTNPIPKPNPDPININLNPNPNNPNHYHTPRTENSLELIQLSVPGDGKYHLQDYMCMKIISRTKYKRKNTSVNNWKESHQTKREQSPHLPDMCEDYQHDVGINTSQR